MSLMARAESKTPEESSVNDYVYKIFPYDLNDQGTMFGGSVASQLDRVAVVVAQRHSQRVCVTASIDAVHFLAPARKGDNLIIQASLNRAWNTSMEVGLRVLAENGYYGERRHIVSAYFTYIIVGFRNRPNAAAVVFVSAAVALAVHFTLGPPWHIATGGVAGVVTAFILAGNTRRRAPA